MQTACPLAVSLAVPGLACVRPRTGFLKWLVMLHNAASRGGDPGSPEPFRGKGDGGVDIGAPSCTANTPTRGVSRGACVGPRSPLDGPSRAAGRAMHDPVRASHGGDPSSPKPFRSDSDGGVSTLARPPARPTRLLVAFLVAPFLARVRPQMGPFERLAMLRMPPVGAPRGGDLVSHVPFHGEGGGVSCHALCLGANASGSAVAAISAMPMSLMLAVPSVGAGVAYAPCSCTGHIAVPLAAARPHRGLPRSHTCRRTGHVFTCTDRALATHGQKARPLRITVCSRVILLFQNQV